MSILTGLVWAPSVGALVVLALPGERPSLRRAVALGFALVSLGLATLVFFGDGGDPRREIAPWIAPLGVSYELAFDGFGSTVALWIAVLAPVVLLSERPPSLGRRTAALLLLAETALLGLAGSGDFVLFLAFYGAGLVAMTLLHQRPGAMKGFFVFQAAGLSLMAGLFVTCFHVAWAQTGFPSAEIGRLSTLVVYPDAQSDRFLLGAAALAFAAPLFPLATWLKESEEALSSTALLFLLGGWSLAGAQFFVRIVLPSFPTGASDAAGVVSLFAALGVVFAGLLPYRGTRERSWLPALFGMQALSLLGLLSSRTDGIVAGRLGLLQLGVGMALLGLATGGAESTAGLPLTKGGRVAAVGVVLAAVVLPGADGLPVYWRVLASLHDRSPTLALVAGVGLALLIVRLLLAVPNLARSLHRNGRRGALLMLPILGWWLWISGSGRGAARIAPPSALSKPGGLDEEEP
jgi:NADH-quinone oxidoreductase subunit M